MGYRKYINILKKDDYNKLISAYKLNQDIDVDTDDPKCFDLYDFKEKYRSEVCDDLPLDQFEEIDINEQEYHPLILDKSDFRKIIVFYQELQIKNSQNVLDRQSKIENIEDDKKSQRLINDSFFNYVNHAHNVSWYFKNLIESDILMSDSDYFLLQYFELVKLYEGFNDEKDILIITHG